jgi:hypothetical protein
MRQIQDGVGQEPDEAGNETASEAPTAEEIVSAELAAEQYEPIVQVIKIVIAAFSLLLLGLSLSAYRKTALRRILYASVAFGLFAVQMFYEYLEDAVEAFETPFGDVIFSAITLAILALFFAAIVRKK